MLYGFGGHHDWRLPTIKELASILESACYKPALNETIFPRAMAGNGKEVNDGYVYLWSSTRCRPFRASLTWTSPAAPSPSAPRSWAKQVLLVR
jgi:hypothetical protein